MSEGRTCSLLKAIEHVARIAQERSLDPVFNSFELHPLAAVPADQVPSQEFRTRRWPQILALVEEQRRAYALRHERQAARREDPRR